MSKRAQTHRDFCFVGVAVGVVGIFASSCAKLESGDPQESPKPLPTCADGLVAAAKISPVSDAPQVFGVCDDPEGLTVAIGVTDRGQPVTGLALAQIRFGVARLTTTPSGTVWQSYINRLEEPGTGDWPGLASTSQATVENNGILKEYSRGIYTYTFAVNIRAVVSPLAVAYDRESIHRVGFELRGEGLPRANPYYTWTPNTGAPAPNVRTIVVTETCNECHDILSAHGGSRIDVAYCGMCHNPGTFDAQSGESLDFGVMVHKIHSGSQLPSVVAGTPYAIWGFNKTKFDFSEVVYPQDTRNCIRCHDAAKSTTPQGGNWQSHPTLLACGSCHDNVSFAAEPAANMMAHTGGPQAEDALCGTCHSPENIEKKHRTNFATPHNPSAADDIPVFKHELLALTNASPGEQLQVTFRILMNGAPLDLLALPAGLAVGQRFLIAWSAPEGSALAPADFNNVGNGQNLGQARRVDLNAIIPNLVAIGDGSFVTRSGDLGSVGAGASRVTVAIEGGFNVTRSSGGPAVRISPDSVTISDAATPARRQVVAIDKCNVCHERLALHGGNRVNNIEVCVMCHNPNATDRSRRPADATTSVDGLAEQSVDFKELIHKIHMGDELTAAQHVVYGFGSTPFDFTKAVFPGNPAKCTTCHEDGTYELPIATGVLATTKSAGVSLIDPQDDLNVSPTGAACAGCHDSDSALAHAKVSDVWWNAQLNSTEVDDCAICHGVGKAYDVRSVHGLW